MGTNERKNGIAILFISKVSDTIIVRLKDQINKMSREIFNYFNLGELFEKDISRIYDA